MIDRLTSDATGEIELEKNVLVIRRIHVRYNLAAPDAPQELIERVHDIHKEGCPIYRSIQAAIDITTEWQSTQPPVR